MRKLTFIFFLYMVVNHSYANFDLIDFKNCSLLKVEQFKTDIPTDEIPNNYLFKSKKYSYAAVPVSYENETMCLIVDKKNKIIIDSIPIPTSGLCQGEWDNKQNYPIWRAYTQGGRGKSELFHYSTSHNLKDYKRSNKVEINDAIDSLSCQLPSLSNDSIEEINNSAFYLYKLGYYNESLFFFKNVLKRDPDRVVAYLNIADVYQALNQKEEARKNYNIYSLKMKKLGLTKKIPDRVSKNITL